MTFIFDVIAVGNVILLLLPLLLLLAGRTPFFLIQTLVSSSFLPAWRFFLALVFCPPFEGRRGEKGGMGHISLWTIMSD